jgi:hypothetical protein
MVAGWGAGASGTLLDRGGWPAKSSGSKTANTTSRTKDSLKEKQAVKTENHGE